MTGIVLDTNVLMSGLLSPHGPPGQILEPAAVDAVMDFLGFAGQRVTVPPLPVELPDPDDLAFLEVAAAAAVPLVTGNPRHFVAATGRHGVTVLSPKEFLRRLST